MFIFNVSLAIFSESLERPNIEAILEEAANRVREEARVSVEHQGQIKLAFDISCACLSVVFRLSLKSCSFPCLKDFMIFLTRFLVWVSFCEIYNEYIYDLLEPIPKKKNARRHALILRDDKNGSPYVKGLWSFYNIK